MTDSNDSNKPKLTIQQIQQLAAMQQGTQQNKLSPAQARAQKIIAKVFHAMQKMQFWLDRFINFITKPSDEDRNDVVQAARYPILFGVYVTIIFVGIGGIWSMVAPLNSAVIAIGNVVSSSNKKVIQHQEGGIIKNIYVAAGDHVKEGDKLVELEDAKTRSEYESTLNQYRSGLASESRLIAERDGLDSIEFPEFLKQNSHIPEVEKIMHTQENLFRYRKEIYRAEKESHKQRILQSHKEIEALEARKLSADKSLQIMSERLKGLKVLLNKGYASKATVLDAEAKEANFKSEAANTETSIAKAQQEITRVEIENINIENKFIDRALSELKDVQAQTAVQKERYTALADSLQRIVIKSPVDGVVNSVNIHTIGGVIGSGAPILEISPTNDNLIIEAKVPHKNVDSVHVGLTAKIRFSAFKSRTTPLFTGRVVSISPDVVQDRTQAQQDPSGPYYIAKIEIDMDEFNKIASAKNLALHPGMMAEIQIVTGTRTLFRYLLDPVTDTMFKAFREK